MESLLNWLSDLVARAGHWSYAVIFAAATLESAAFLGLLVPGEALVLLAGFLSAQGVLHLDVLLVVGIALLLVFLFAWLGRWTARHEAELKERWQRLQQHPRWQAWRTRLAPQIAWLQARLSPTGYLGLRLTLGVVMMIGGAWLFGGVAEDVIDRDPLTLVDVILAQWLQDHATEGLTALALAVTHAHDWAPVLVATLLLCGFFAWRRQREWLIVTVLTVPGGMLLNWGIKLAFRRPRPTVSDYVHALQSWSFPSGHTVAATLFWGLVAVYMVSLARSWTQRVTIVWLALACIVLVAFSRVYLGVHFLSDVLAAMGVGAFWLALSTTTAHTLSAARRARNGAVDGPLASSATNQHGRHTGP